jgi:MFS family permease
MLANLVGITAGGAAADRHGPARPFTAGTLLFAAGLLASGLAPTMEIVVLGRTAQGLGGGLLSSVAYVSIARGYAPEVKPRMLAILASAWVVPGLVGPALAGAIADHAGWRWVFLGLAPLPLCAAATALPALRRLPASPDRRGEPGRTWTSVLLAAGTGGALAGLGTRSPGAAAALLAAGGAAAVLALRRLLPAGTLAGRAGLPAAVATMGLLNLAFFGSEAFLPLALSAVRGQSATMIGLALTAATLTWTAGAWLQVRLAPRAARRDVVTAGLLLVGAGIAGTSAVLVPGVATPAAVAGWGVAGLGMGLAFSTTSLSVLESAPAGEEGAASASMQLAQVLGAALSTGAGGAIVASALAGDPPRLGIGLVNLLMILAVALAVATARRMPGGREAA